MVQVLRTLDLTQSLDRDVYREIVPRLQVRLRDQAFELYQRQRNLIAVFEGWDAAGKGGAIRRLTARLDPRGYEVHSIGKPEAGADRHYLWRFWQRLVPPDQKQVLVFDRSWYGRVLVERVEGFATEEEWNRAYREINHFERQLVDAGMIIAKFWFHISPEEQLTRFEARRRTPHKQWKLTDEDWRNRDRWDDYVQAVDEMLVKTSTLEAPWTLVEGNDKYHARHKVLEVLCAVLDRELEESDRAS